jgi:hypothetical protein
MPRWESQPRRQQRQRSGEVGVKALCALRSHSTDIYTQKEGVTDEAGICLQEDTKTDKDAV